MGRVRRQTACLCGPASLNEHRQHVVAHPFGLPPLAAPQAQACRLGSYIPTSFHEGGQFQVSSPSGLTWSPPAGAALLRRRQGTPQKRPEAVKGCAYPGSAAHPFNDASSFRAIRRRSLLLNGKLLKAANGVAVRGRRAAVGTADDCAGRPRAIMTRNSGVEFAWSPTGYGPAHPT